MTLLRADISPLVEILGWDPEIAHGGTAGAISDFTELTLFFSSGDFSREMSRRDAIIAWNCCGTLQTKVGAR